ncbi:3-oxoacyl-ACP synthase III family protein [Streptomyces roseus]|uniref:3-oxoacyl-ACP synthase III family protein n=1 Tax=Streptomyces roseus TaxID=66430 RepID=UPI0037F4EB8E
MKAQFASLKGDEFMSRQAISPAIGVTGIGVYTPSSIRTYQDTAMAVNMPEQWVLSRTGIHQRHVAGDQQATSDLAAAAAQAALASAGLSAEEIGLIVLGTTTPDEPCPATACRVQALLDARNAVALDVSGACSSWLFGVKVAQEWMASDTRVRHAVVIGSEVYSRFLDFSDRATSVLFGDGAAATVLSRVPDSEGFAPITLASDGTRADYACIPAGGSRHPASTGTLRGGAHYVHMDGRAARVFVNEIFPQLIEEALSSAGVESSKITAVVAHQPNPVLLRKAYANTGMPEDKLIVIGDRVGNLGAGSIPYALAQAVVEKRLRVGDKLLLLAFGAGLTWGSAVLTWSGATLRDPTRFRIGVPSQSTTE